MVNIKENRNLYIGGSDIPIIMNISPFKSRFDLLLEKAELKEDDFKGNEYTEFGNILEPKIREYINKSLYPKNPFKEDTLIKDDLRGNFDGINKTAILEIKTTSQVHDNIDDYKIYLVQLLFYMQLAKKEKGILAVYKRPDNFDEEFDEKRLQIFMIDINNYKKLLEEINIAIKNFREDLIKIKENPFLTEEDLTPIDLTNISNKIIALEEKMKEYKEIEKQQKELKEKLKKEMEKHNIKKWTTNNGIQITLVEDAKDKEVEVFNEEKFKEENEELYKRYLEKTIKKGRSGYVKITFPKN